MPYTDEVDGLGVMSPAEIVNVRVEGLGQELLLARSEVVEAEALAVTLITIAGHGEPGHVASVGRELRVLVVTRHVLQVLFCIDGLCAQRLGGLNLRSHIVSRLAEVRRRARTYIIYIDVRVGRNRVSHACLLAAGIGNALGVGAPVQLFHAAKRLHGTFVGLSFKDVNTVVSYGKAIAYRTNEGVQNALHVVIPVAIHQVCDQTACSFRQVGRVLLNAAVEGNALQHDDLLTVRRELKALNAAVGLRHLATVRAVSLHGPDFTTGDEGDGLVV